ncbi:MAG: aldehyde ferredoxin oxidoreductase family protein [Clostridia bacterium]|jgi:aldehyde:ferredoxin oxidoreductase|nr:aldehyde ferredoxin oxidoreductase family protein [Clostridia bacterium]MDH7572999.1 aldehyde ferredoxin oxidoreductase family protein [Clostridia bacterium]
MPQGGYMGKILIVDLARRTYEEVDGAESLYREYIGGYGLGARILYEVMRPGVDPLGPENVIGFVTGTFVGTKVHGGGRFNVVAKSPLTGGWADSSCGGRFGPRLRRAGYDGIFVRGCSDKPVYLWVSEGRVEFRDASHLWGKDALETEDIVRSECGREVGVITIGLAGENRCWIAGLIHDQGRAAARQGLGAVMGAKLLKAVAVEGSKEVPVADMDAYERVLRVMSEDLKSRPHIVDALRQFGTPVVYVTNVAMQDAPIQNWKGISSEVYPLERAQRLGPEVYLGLEKRKYACAQCGIACGALIELDGPTGPLRTHRPEYETIAAFGSMCLVDDVATVIRANHLCNRYGLDTISAGATIAFAMECYERGLITDKETDGLSLKWGNKDAILPLIEMMARREGIGAVLADGVRLASQRIGGGSEEFAIHVGGQELACHDPRCWPGFGYGYALDPTPGRHTQGGVGFIEHGWTDKTLEKHGYNLSHLAQERYSYHSKGKVLALLNHWFQFFNSTGMCLFNVYGYQEYPILEAFRAVTGWTTFDLNEALTAGARINTLRHCFNLREGVQPQRWTLPERVRGNPPLAGGPTAGVTIDLEAVKADYYRELDWDAVTGEPSPRELRRLNLAELVGRGAARPKES